MEEQSGFRAGRSCTDNIFSIKNLTEKRTARNLERHLVFVDLQKAYDSVPIKKLFEVLDSSNIEKEYIAAIRSLHWESYSQMKIDNRVSEPFVVNKGLRQECCLSPTLFNVYTDAALKTWSAKCKGMGIPIGEQTRYTLLFADDQVIVAADAEDVSYMTRKLKEEFTKWGLEKNMSKTKHLAIGATAQDIKIGGNTIEACMEFKYLGGNVHSYWKQSSRHLQ
jgi:sorting nexin-29